MRGYLMMTLAGSLLTGAALAGPIDTDTLPESTVTFTADGDASEWFTGAALESTAVGQGVVSSDNILVFNDPDADDLGDGDYTDPTSTVYGNESDIREVRVASTNQGLNFLVVSGADTGGITGSSTDSSQFISPAGTVNPIATPTTSTGPTGAPSPADLSGIVTEFNNTNTAGVTGGTGADANGATCTTGLEMFIPAAALEVASFAAGDTVQVFAIVTGSTDYKSNQTLPGLTAGTSNLGTADFDFSTVAGTGSFSSTAPASPVAFSTTGITTDGSVADSASYLAGGGVKVVQTIQTQFGDNFSELDQGFLRVCSDGIALAICGNLEGNGNGLIIYVNSHSGGEQVLTGAPPDVPRTAGMNGDTLPFAADVAFEINAGGGGVNYYIDWSDVDAPSAPRFAGRVDILLSSLDNTGSLDIGNFCESEVTAAASSADLAYEMRLTLGGSSVQAVGTTGDFSGDVAFANSFNEGQPALAGGLIATEFSVPITIGSAQLGGFNPFAGGPVNIVVASSFTNNGGLECVEVDQTAGANNGGGSNANTYLESDFYDLLSTTAGQAVQDADILAAGTDGTMPGAITNSYIRVDLGPIAVTPVAGYELYR